MKIMHIAKFYPPEPGGMENFVADLGTAQVRKGHLVYVLAHHTDAAMDGVVENVRGVMVERVRIFGHFAYTPICPDFYLSLKDALRAFQPDVIHVHLPNVSAFWLLFLPKYCPLVIHWHADVVASAIDRKMAFFYAFYKPWEQLLLKRADRVICTSGAYLRYSNALHKWKNKCDVIPLGLDPERRRLARPIARSEKRARPFTVLSVGRFAYYKGFAYLVKAAANVPDTCFILVGDGPRFHSVKKLVIQKQLQARCKFPGRVNDRELKTFFDQCDVFCLPSVERTEAFGLVLLEAMYFAKPLVSTQIRGSGVTAVNVHNHTGLQVPPADPKALADALNQLRMDGQARARMGKQALKRFEDHFHIDPVADKILGLYHRLLI